MTKKLTDKSKIFHGCNYTSLTVRVSVFSGGDRFVLFLCAKDLKFVSIIVIIVNINIKK